MRQVTDPKILREYIDRYHLQALFSFDLMQAASISYYEKDELMCLDGEIYNYLSFLLEGECIAYVVTYADKLHCEAHYRGFNPMGLVGALWGMPSINTIRAITPCVMLDISLATHRNLLLNDARFLRYAAKSLAQHIRQNAFHFERLEIRLARFILKMEQDGVFSYNLTICADLLEVSYRHLLRTMREFCETGALRKGKRGQYILQNREILERLRDGEEPIHPHSPEAP